MMATNYLILFFIFSISPLYSALPTSRTVKRNIGSVGDHLRPYMWRNFYGADSQTEARVAEVLQVHLRITQPFPLIDLLEVALRIGWQLVPELFGINYLLIEPEKKITLNINSTYVAHFITRYPDSACQHYLFTSSTAYIRALSSTNSNNNQ